MSDLDPALMICEAGAAWQRRLRPRLPSVKLWGHSQVDRLGDLASASPRAAWLLVGQEETLDAALRATWLRNQSVRQPCVVVVLPTHLSPHAGVFRQAGAVWVQTDWREWRQVLRVLERHWQRLPQPPRDITARIWERLPWRELANSADR